MTCIVGLEVPGNGNKKGYVIMGGDSAASTGYTIRKTSLEKVFVVDNRFLIGYTGSFRIGQLLKHKLAVDDQKSSQSDINYLVTTFVDSLKKTLEENGIKKVVDSVDSIGDDGAFLLGYNGKLYDVNGDYQVNAFRHGYEAAGSGFKFALGAMSASESLKPKGRIKSALKAATKFDVNVCKPFVIKRLGVTNGR